jgi:hypothetical protein
LSRLAATASVGVHQRPPWPLSRTQLVEQADRMLASVRALDDLKRPVR